MIDWFLLAELHVLQGMAQARAMGYPALSTAREKARRFACALQWTTPLSSLLPAPPRATTYESLDHQRQLCTHVNELTGMSQTKMYVAAQKRWLLCTLCQRRWMQLVAHTLTPCVVPVIAEITNSVNPLFQIPNARAHSPTHPETQPSQLLWFSLLLTFTHL